MRLRRRLLTWALLPALLAALATTWTAAPVAAFDFQWTGQPTAPLRWVPPATNSWDVLVSNANSESTGISRGSFAAGHGPDCSTPPAQHSVSALADTVFICNDHLMTAENDTDTFLVPNQLADWSNGQTATVSFKVSTLRMSQRDWWELWLMPFDENFSSPTDNAPFFNGNPSHALHIVMDNRNGCRFGQPNLPDNNNPGSFGGTFFRYVLYNGSSTSSGGGGDCMEDVAGGVSAATRSQFNLSVSASHVVFGMQGPSSSTRWIDDNLVLPFQQSVVMLAHRSYDPNKACGGDGTCGPNTFHWSDFHMGSTVPFTMLRPSGLDSIRAGVPGTVTLPQPAPAGSFLRFSAFGNPRVSLDGGAFQTPHKQDATFRQEAPSNYFTPIPEGTRTVSFQGTSRGGMAWWVEDVAVWARTQPAPTPTPTPTSTPTATPSPTPTSTPAATPFPCDLTYDGAGHAGSCQRNADGTIVFQAA